MFDGFELIENLHHLSEMNRIENYVCFQAVDLKKIGKKCKNKKMFENDHRKSHENENRPKSEA